MTRLLSLALFTSLMAFALSLPGITHAETRSTYVSQIVVKKSERKLHLVGAGRILRSYDIDLGFAPKGHKRFQGDGRTPEGTYRITHRNPQSAFYLSLGVSYPNNGDRAYAQARGRSPGGDIFIHGRAPGRPFPGPDWTAGCIAVSDADMDEIYRYVRPGIAIVIMP